MDTYILKKTPFSGVATALATPFSGGEVDLDAFRRLVEWQVDMGIDALCVAGTTGESATLTRAERRRLTVCAKDAANGRVPVIVGCGSADTATACTLCHDAVALGADALLVITPYCNKGTASGIVEHFKRIAEAAGDRPVILYNVPSRTGVDLTLEQYQALSALPNVCAVKEAAANFTKITRLCGETNLAVYSGNDDMILPVVSLGGSGVISVLSNLAPAAVAAMTHAAMDGDFATAQKLAHKYARLIALLFAETNPAPLKYAMQQLELCSGEMRLPLAEIGESLQSDLRAELTKLSML